MTDTEKIRQLNDEFRTTFNGGRVMATRGVMARSDVPDILQRVREFTDFSQDNDPHGEHDFGSFDQHGEQIFWKIDYYDLDLQMGSPDPAQPETTTRLLTILMSSEW